MKNIRKYTIEFQDEVLTFLRTHSMRATANRFNIPLGTVNGWARAEQGKDRK